jgi:DNA replication and repair protein RecF
MLAQKNRLRINRLSLTNFRNYRSASLCTDDRTVVLIGANGAGKTNCLEAISLLAPGRGLRGVPFADLAIQGGDGGWAVFAELNAGEAVHTIGTGLEQALPGQPEKTARTVRINGANMKTPGALARYGQMVWLTPAMDGLFTGPAGERRRFLDRLLINIDPANAVLAGAYERAMRQRNKALEIHSSAAVLDSLEVQMAETGTALMFARRDALAALASEFTPTASCANEKAFPWASLALSGPLDALVTQLPAAAVEDAFLRQLYEGRERDRAARRSLTGPHRTDLLVTHGPKNMAARLCSTGEQKALLLGLVLAQASLIKALKGGTAPLLLLDEVAAHLDETRRNALFGEILRLGCQAWMTGTDRFAFEALLSGGEAQFFLVSDGAIVR